MEAQRDERIEMGVALAASREKAHQALKWLAEAEENLSRAKAGEQHVKINVDKKLGEAKKRIEMALAEVQERHEEDMGRVESRVDKANGVLERARENYQRELAAKEAEVAVLDGMQGHDHIVINP
jgi:predicted extracellular nuclease